MLHEGRGRNRKQIFFLLDVFNPDSGMSVNRSRIYFKICMDCIGATVITWLDLMKKS